MAVTALLCGGFLWWWFQPIPHDPGLERDPLYWLGLARKELGSREPTASARFETLMVALSFQRSGKEVVVTAIDGDWFAPPWRAALQPRPWADRSASTEASSIPPVAFAPVLAAMSQARTALDELEVDRARAAFHQAVTAAESLAQPESDQALWLVACRQARSGLRADAKQTCSKITSQTDPRSLPQWLILEFIHAEMAAPVVAWIEAHPSEISAVLSELVNVMGDRLLHREAGELANHGPRGDPTSDHTGTDALMFEIHQAVEAGSIQTARASAQRLPAGPERADAYLAIARTLAWK